MAKQVKPDGSRQFVEHAYQAFEQLQAAETRTFPAPSLDQCLCLVRGIIAHGGTPSETLFALTQTYVAINKRYLIYKDVRKLLLSLVSGGKPTFDRDPQDAWVGPQLPQRRGGESCEAQLSSISAMSITRWSSDGKQLRRLHWDFAATSRKFLACYLSMRCDFNIRQPSRPDGGLCCHNFLEPLLLWTQRKAWSEIRFGIARCFGSNLPSDVFEVLFEAALETEEVPTKPTIHTCALMLEEPFQCKVYALVSRMAKGHHLQLEEGVEL
jgi:hypothetical protein